MIILITVTLLSGLHFKAPILGLYTLSRNKPISQKFGLCLPDKICLVPQASRESPTRTGVSPLKKKLYILELFSPFQRH